MSDTIGRTPEFRRSHAIGSCSLSLDSFNYDDAEYSYVISSTDLAGRSRGPGFAYRVQSYEDSSVVHTFGDGKPLPGSWCVQSQSLVEECTDVISGSAVVANMSTLPVQALVISATIARTPSAHGATFTKSSCAPIELLRSCSATARLLDQ